MKSFIIIYNMKSKIVCFLLALLASLFIFNQSAFACTGVFVGSEVSKDGTTLIGRCDDSSILDKPFSVKVYGGNDGEQISAVNSSNGFSWNLPENIHRAIVFPTAKVVDRYGYVAAGLNDCGVNVNATVTGYVSKTCDEKNPAVKGGIAEDQIPLIVAASVSTAREGVELLAKIIDEKGAWENSIVFVADQNEAWYMENYGGHEYCAVKCPEDCVAVMGNEFMLETVNENSEDVICSKNLFKTPIDNGFACYDANGKMNLFNTYVGEDNVKDKSRMRTWRGHALLSPSTIGDYNATTKYPLFYKPDHNVSLSEVEDIFRDRYEGTKYDLDLNGKGKYRSIGTETSESTHILQIYKDLPQDSCVLDWVSYSNPEFTSYIPFSNIESKFDYSVAYENEDYFTLNDDNNFVAQKTLNALADQNREKLGKGIKNYWKFFDNYTSAVISDILHNSTDKKDAQNKINDFCSAFQNQSHYDAKRMCKELERFFINAEDSYGLVNKNGNDVPREINNYSPYVDICLIAKMLGWNVDENKLQDHNPDNPYDNSHWGDPTQANNGGKEGYVKLSNGNNIIEIHTGNGHRTSKSIIMINNEKVNANTKVNDGKTFVDFSLVNKMSELSGKDNYSNISYNDISSMKSYDKNNVFDLNGTQILNIVVIAVLAIAVIILGVKLYKKKK